MGRVHERLDRRLREFIERQHLFFVATAPLEGGHVNVSPKGVGGTFTVVDAGQVAYLDVTASGAETIAHLREDGRITLMFCAFDAGPNVVRLHGRGRVVSIYDDEFAAWLPRFTETRGARAVVVVDLERVSSSCGYGVPLWTMPGSGTSCRGAPTGGVRTGSQTTAGRTTAPASTGSPRSTTTRPDLVRARDSDDPSALWHRPWRRRSMEESAPGGLISGPPGCVARPHLFGRWSMGQAREVMDRATAAIFDKDYAALTESPACGTCISYSGTRVTLA